MASSSYFVYSSLSNDVEYADWLPRKPGASGPNTKTNKGVVIRGKANVVDKNHLITPRGAVTRINAAQKEFLENHSLFKRHKDSGFICVENIKADPNEVAHKKLTIKDSAAPLTPDDYKDKNLPQPKLEKDRTL